MPHPRCPSWVVPTAAARYPSRSAQRQDGRHSFGDQGAVNPASGGLWAAASPSSGDPADVPQKSRPRSDHRVGLTSLIARPGGPPSSRSFAVGVRPPPVVERTFPALDGSTARSSSKGTARVTFSFLLTEMAVIWIKSADLFAGVIGKVSLTAIRMRCRVAFVGRIPRLDNRMEETHGTEASGVQGGLAVEVGRRGCHGHHGGRR